MTNLAISRRVRVWEWVTMIVAVACVAYALSGCAGVQSAVDPLERHGTQLAIGTGAGAGVGLLVGATGWGVVVAALVGAAVTIFSTPDCSEIARASAPGVVHPTFSVLQLVIWGGIAYVLWIRRARVMDALRSRGDPKMMFKQLAHAFLGTARPGETR